MQAAALPANEIRRLASLRALNILDTDHEGVFRAFTRLAGSLIGTPISVLSLVDANRQWFKASEGFDRTETPRSHSFCAHAILNPDEVMVVPDARDDARFADNPLVTGKLGIRFYAGAPVQAEDGLTLGTLCVMDRQSREFGLRERAQLADLAAGASSALQLHGALQRMGRATMTDTLTGAASRLALTGAMCRLANKPPVETGVAVLMADMDGFKQINDAYGHAVGDAALREVTRRMKRSLRPDDMVARLGGDEFVLLCHDLAEPEAARAIALRIQTEMAEPFWLDNVEIPLSLSLGWAVLPWDGVNPDGLLSQADAALYRNKQSRRADVLPPLTQVWQRTLQTA